MDNIASPPLPVLRKSRKKQVKDEMDRLKQAEKKKRRLEKALATSAAIRSELEKKKQKKIEEQQRLEAEGAAIAEAVALHVLCEDSEDSCQIVLNKNKGFEFSPPRDGASNIGVIMGEWKVGGSCPSFTGLGWVSDAYGFGSNLGNWGIGGNVPTRFLREKDRGAEISVGLSAAAVVSSLHIAEDKDCNSFSSDGMGTIVINGMLAENSAQWSQSL